MLIIILVALHKSQLTRAQAVSLGSIADGPVNISMRFTFPRESEIERGSEVILPTEVDSGNGVTATKESELGMGSSITQAVEDSLSV